MEQIIQNIYNGKEWVKVTSEPIYNEKNQFTGHFKEINREYVNQFGIFDDAGIYETFINDVNEFRRKNNSSIYLAQGSGHLKIFTTYAIIPEYENLGIAFVKFIESTGLVPEMYNNMETSIIVNVYNRTTLEESKIRLENGADYVSTIR